MDLISTTPNLSIFVVTLLCLFIATAFLLAMPFMSLARETGPGGEGARRRHGLSIHVTDDCVLVHQSAAFLEHPLRARLVPPGVVVGTA